MDHPALATTDLAALRDYRDWSVKFDLAVRRMEDAVADGMDSEFLSEIKQMQALHELHGSAWDLMMLLDGGAVSSVANDDISSVALSGMGEAKRILGRMNGCDWPTVRNQWAPQLEMALKSIRRKTDQITGWVSSELNIREPPLLTMGGIPYTTSEPKAAVSDSAVDDLMTREEIAEVAMLSPQTLANQKLLGAPAQQGGGRGRKSKWQYVAVRGNKGDSHQIWIRPGVGRIDRSWFGGLTHASDSASSGFGE